MAASDIPICPRCGRGEFGLAFWLPGAPPICLWCRGAPVVRTGGWKTAAAAKHRETLHRIAAAGDEGPKRASVLIAKHTLRTPVVAQDGRSAAEPDPEPSAAVPMLRDRLRARRQDGR